MLPKGHFCSQLFDPMNIADFPFSTVTLAAVFIHLVCGIIATILKPVWKGDTTLDRWWGPAQMARFFTVKRVEVGSVSAWRLIVTSRVAFLVAAVSFVLDLLIN